MPESTDPYLAMGPLHAAGDAPAPPAPDAVPDDTSDFDDGVEDFSLLDEEAPSGPQNVPDGDAGDGESDGEGEDREWLLERARRADELERLFGAQEASQRQQAAEKFWNDKLDQANNWFAGLEATAWANAEQSLNPTAYLREELTKIRNQANDWYATYRDSREQALWEFTQAQELPRYAARVVEHYKLPKEAVSELLEYHPDQIEREAQKMRSRLIKERKRQKELDQLKRSDWRRTNGQPLGTGTGRGAATGGGDVTPGSDEHYFAIPWVRGR